MLGFLKVFLRGIIITVLLPFILVVWVLYGVYCLFLFIVMFFKSIISFFAGNNPAGEMPEDLEAKRILLEREKTQDQAQQAMAAMYQTVMAQAQAAAVAAQQPVPQPQPTYGPQMYSEPIQQKETSTENVEEPKVEGQGEEETNNDNSY